MPLFASPIVIKVRLELDDGSEARKVELAKGASTTLADTIALLEERFRRPMLPSVRYEDEGDMVTASTDVELQAALGANVRTFTVSPVPAPKGGNALLEGWEDLGEQTTDASGSEPETCEAKEASVQWSNTLKFWLNGEEIVIENPSPNMMLVDYLREQKGLTGTKVGCHQGKCGICTVAIAFGNGSANPVGVSVPVNSCLRRLCLLDGCHVTTTEGLGDKTKGVHAVQKAIADGNGSQCGYCTPGWVMQMYSLLSANEAPSREGIEQNFDGNFCRCTGYRPILKAFGEFAKGGRECGTCERKHLPAEMMTNTPMPLHFTDAVSGCEWYRPLSLDQMPDIKAAVKASGKTMAYICAGVGTYVGGSYVPSGTVYLDLTGIVDLQAVTFDAKAGLTCGATVPIHQVITSLEANATACPSFASTADYMTTGQSYQLRSVSSWAGNVMQTRGDPTYVSDVVAALSGACAVISILDSTGTKVDMSITELLASTGDVLVLSVRFPPLSATSVLQHMKASNRHTHDERTANFSGFLDIGAGGVVSKANIYLGGTTKNFLFAAKTEAAIVGKQLDQATFTAALACFLAEIRASPSPDPAHTAAYRESLATGFLYKTFLAAQAQLPANYASAIVPFIQARHRPVTSGAETYGSVPTDAPVGTYVPKIAARIQASGEAVYTSDASVGSLFGQLVISTSANAKLLTLDASAALKMPGVVGFVAATDIPGLNCVGSSVGGANLLDKVFFEVGDKIPCVGVQLGLIVAETWIQANAAALSVKQVYATGAVVATMEDARLLGHRASPDDIAHAHNKHMQRPDIRSRRGLKDTVSASGVSYEAGAPRADADKEVKATFKTGGQRHWYMETQSVVARPVDGDKMEFTISDQDPNTSAMNLAAVLNVPYNLVNCIQRRAGGAFGGKLLRQVPLAAACGVAARKLRRAVRAQNTRDDDMAAVAGREPIDFDYNVTFDATGKVDTMNLKMDVNCGWYYGDAAGDVSMAVGWADNCYHYNTFKVVTNIYTTDTPHTTSMRAPGCMQSLIAAEVAIEHVAKSVGRPVEEVQFLNFYAEGDATPFGDTIGKDNYNWTIPTLWKQIQQSTDYVARKQAVADFNKANRWTKRGISLNPVKYVASTSFYKSGAEVCIYGDGSVIINHGGCELGQGINTVATLCAAQTLGIPIDKITVGTTETAKVANNTGTGGSGTTECTARGVDLACQELKTKLQKYMTPGKTWEDAVTAAVTDGVGLMATSFFDVAKTDNTNNYATYGVAISEAMVDVLTGEVRVERTDILMDLGTQLDAAVDLGQLEGGFVQALGYVLTEELKVDSTGTQLSVSTYAIPGAYDIPVVFNCSLLKDSPNPAGIRGSKLCSEPAMGLVSSLYFAVKNAIYAARVDAGLGDDWFMLNLPATPQNICASIGTPSQELLVPTGSSKVASAP